MAPLIFISYRRTDAGGHAGRIFDRLRPWFNAENVFYDQETIEIGDQFPDRIDTAIRSAKVVLVIIGPDWLNTLNANAAPVTIDYVHKEVAIGIERQVEGEAELIPVLVAGTRMPRKDELHVSLQQSIGPLFDYQAHTFHGRQTDWDHQFERLRCRLADVLASQTLHTSAPSYDLHARMKPPDISIGVRPPPATPHVPISPEVSQAIERVFGNVSRMLLNWPQEIDGQWIDRPELQRLHELTSREPAAVTVLLGGPGEGKSAILARLGRMLAEEGVVLLAIKADRVPRDISSLSELDDWIGCGVEVVRALRRLASERRVVVLIDQLDALADLMDRHTERLSVLLRLVEEVRETPNLHVLLSCRAFEFRNDVRLNSISAEEVLLARPSWDAVLPLLRARGVDTDGWSDEVRDLVSTPQTLSIYLDHLAEDVPLPAFPNYQGALERVINKRLESVYGTRTVYAAERIATEMANDEEIWVGRARFPDFSAQLANLQAAGFLVLSENRMSVSFRHQTMFDIFRARSFLRQNSSLANHVINEKQASLFVRPILWSTLNYLRASDSALYRTEFHRMWTHEGLRLHLRYLLISFLGQVDDPDPDETRYLLTTLNAVDTRTTVLRAILGSRSWFSLIRSLLPTLMTDSPRSASATARLFISLVNREPDVVLEFVRRYWIKHEQHWQHAVEVLCSLESWTTEFAELAERLAAHRTRNDGGRRLILQIAKSRPDLAIRVFSRHLQGPLRCSAGARSIANDTMWYHLHLWAKECPREFLNHLWSWLLDMFSHDAEDSSVIDEYRDHHGVPFATPPREHDYLQMAFEAAIRSFAQIHANAFLAFVQENERSDLKAVHRLLALGLARIAPDQPLTVLEYLLADPRRLEIGDFYDPHRDSKALIAATVPAIQLQDARRLEAALGVGSHDIDAADDENPNGLSDRMRARRKRLRLLRSFPVDRLSPDGQRCLEEDEGFLPDTPDEDHQPIEVREVTSPMSSAQMEKETDEDIVGLFHTLTDDTEWRHPQPDSPFVGGSVQASREFAKFAEGSPDRCLRIVRSFQPCTNERPAGAALAALGSSTVPVSTLIGVIRDLHNRGFASEEFRRDAAKCLREVACRNRGLDDDTCELVEGWVTSLCKVPDVAAEIAIGGAESSGDKTGTVTDSLLWGGPNLVQSPGGNGPILDALTCGHLLRESPALGDWLAALERHLTRNENPKVWSATAIHLPYLVNCDDRGRVLRFFQMLFRQYPGVLQSRVGVRTIGRIVDAIPERMTHAIVDGWISGNWAHGPQAAGEIVALQLCRKPESTGTRALVERFLSGEDYAQPIAEGLRIGLTYTLVEAWGNPGLRTVSTPLLARIISMASNRVATVVLSIFRWGDDAAPADGHTRELLQALVNSPCVLAMADDFVVDGLKDLLRGGADPDLISDVASTVLVQTERSECEEDRAAYDLTGLVDLALTLHRIPETREKGIDVFEQLIRADAYGAHERLQQMDRRSVR